IAIEVPSSQRNRPNALGEGLGVAEGAIAIAESNVYRGAAVIGVVVGADNIELAVAVHIGSHQRTKAVAAARKSGPCSKGSVAVAHQDIAGVWTIARVDDVELAVAIKVGSSQIPLSVAPK